MAELAVTRRFCENLLLAGLLRILKVPLQRRLYVGVLWRKEAHLGEAGDAFLQCLREACNGLSDSKH